MQIKKESQAAAAVAKALTPDQLAIMQNIQSLVGQFLELEDANNAAQEGMDKPNDPAEAAKEGTNDTTMEPDEKKTEKAQSPENDEAGATNSGDAETRTEDVLPESTKDGIDEAAKALSILLALGGKQAKKAAPVDPMTQVLKNQEMMMKELLDLKKENVALKSGVGTVLSAFNISEDAIQRAEADLKAAEAQKAKAPKGAPADSNSVLKSLAEEIARMNGGNPAPIENEIVAPNVSGRTDEARKNLGTVIGQLFGR